MVEGDRIDLEKVVTSTSLRPISVPNEIKVWNRVL